MSAHNARIKCICQVRFTCGFVQGNEILAHSRNLSFSHSQANEHDQRKTLPAIKLDQDASRWNTLEYLASALNDSTSDGLRFTDVCRPFLCWSSWLAFTGATKPRVSVLFDLCLDGLCPLLASALGRSSRKCHSHLTRSSQNKLNTSPN